ncbi:hypothetical protein NQZ68_031002 [Dissostichus eleginoides]|nr:hypothetical protein NQZ68_031002 [Dissostichus eleginoides]
MAVSAEHTIPASRFSPTASWYQDGHPGSGAPLCADRENELYSCQHWIDESRGSIGVDAEGVNHGRLPPLVWYLSKNNLSEVDAELESETWTGLRLNGVYGFSLSGGEIHWDYAQLGEYRPTWG